MGNPQSSSFVEIQRCHCHPVKMGSSKLNCLVPQKKMSIENWWHKKPLVFDLGTSSSSEFSMSFCDPDPIYFLWSKTKTHRNHLSQQPRSPFCQKQWVFKSLRQQKRRPGQANRNANWINKKIGFEQQNRASSHMDQQSLVFLGRRYPLRHLADD